MKDICVSILFSNDSNVAAIKIKIEGKERSIQYRIEFFCWKRRSRKTIGRMVKGTSRVKVN